MNRRRFVSTLALGVAAVGQWIKSVPRKIWPKAKCLTLHSPIPITGTKMRVDVPDNSTLVVVPVARGVLNIKGFTLQKQARTQGQIAQIWRRYFMDQCESTVEIGSHHVFGKIHVVQGVAV